LRNLKEFGWGKSQAVKSNVNEESRILLDSWDSLMDPSSGRESAIIPFRGAFGLPIAKIIWKMIVGRVNKEDEVTLGKTWTKIAAFMEEGSFGADPTMVAIFLKYSAPN
jgi:hypothetical protein